MASNITLTGYNEAYPVAGQDNDSQGFRDNFAIIQSSLSSTKTALQDLESKVLLKDALTNTILDKEKVNPVYFIVEPPGISDVTKLGDTWIDGIRSIKFYKPRKDFYELKCLEKYPFTYEPGKDGTSVTEELMTANLCKNGNTNQQFYFSGEHDNKYEPADYDDLSESHIHFHRHPYDSVHEVILDHSSE